MSNQGALALLDDDAAIQEIANGTMLKQIAERYNCGKVAVYKRLSKHPDYPDAIAQQAHAFVQDAMTEVRECDADTVNIARARVDAAFRYAKAHNEAYRDKSEVTHQVGESFAAMLERVAAAKLVAQTPMLQRDSAVRQIDGESERVSD